MSDIDGNAEYAKWQEMYGHMTATELCRAMAKVREQKDDLEAEAAGVAREHEWLSKVAIPDKFAEDGIKNMNIDGIGRINLTADIYASVKAGKKEEAYQWLQDVGSGDLIQPSVPPSTLKAFLKGLVKKGEEVPDSLFNCTPYQMARITKT